MRLLIVVDMQNDFITGALANKEGQQIIDNVKAKIHEYATSTEEKCYVIFTKDTHYDEDPAYLDTEEGKNLPVVHCIKGTAGHEVVPELVEECEHAKACYCKETFGSMELANYIAKEGQDYSTIELVGVCTDICVISNAVMAKAAASPFCHIMVDAACCAGVTPESHDMAIGAMEALHIEVTNKGKEPWR
jgi:nicotinamidase-related amidase